MELPKFEYKRENKKQKFVREVAGRKINILKPPQFSLDQKKEAIEFFEREGYVVFRNVLSHDELLIGRDLHWNILEHMGTKIDRKNPSTWVNAKWPTDNWNSFKYGMVAEMQSEFDWKYRDNSSILNAFASIYSHYDSRPIKGEDLACSFDIWSAFRPNAPELDYKPSKEDWSTSILQPHADQGSWNTSFECIQGFINYIDAGEETGGFLVYPKSNHFHEKLFKLCPKHVKKNRNDWVRLSDEEIEKMCKTYDLQPGLVCAERGSLVLWDSRTIHGSTPYVTKTSDVEDDLVRLVKYQSYMPKYKIPSKVKQFRIKGAKEGVSTSHWVTDWKPKTPRGKRPSSYEPIVIEYPLPNLESSSRKNLIA
jgi:hypothetical protein